MATSALVGGIGLASRVALGAALSDNDCCWGGYHGGDVYVHNNYNRTVNYNKNVNYNRGNYNRGNVNRANVNRANVNRGRGGGWSGGGRGGGRAGGRGGGRRRWGGRGGAWKWAYRLATPGGPSRWVPRPATARERPGGAPL